MGQGRGKWELKSVTMIFTKEILNFVIFFFLNSLRLLLLGCLLNFIISFFFFEVEVNLTMLIILFKPNDKVGQFLHARVYYNFFKWNLDNLYRNNGRGYFFIKE